MKQEPAPFEWGEASETAAKLLAAANLTTEQIAQKVGVSRVTLYRWRQHPEFAARLQEARDEIRAEIRRLGVADPDNRLRRLSDHWTRLQRVVEQRADDPRMAEAPGGSTGLLVRTTKGVGRGEDFTLIHEFAVDTGLLAELRAVERQAAQELGQWTEKVEHGGGLKVIVEYADRPIDPAAAPPGAAGDPGGGEAV